MDEDVTARSNIARDSVRQAQSCLSPRKGGRVESPSFFARCKTIQTDGVSDADEKDNLARVADKGDDPNARDLRRRGEDSDSIPAVSAGKRKPLNKESSPTEKCKGQH